MNTAPKTLSSCSRASVYRYGDSHFWKGPPSRLYSIAATPAPSSVAVRTTVAGPATWPPTGAGTICAVVGRRGRRIKADDAGPYIAGYTLYNDWSARDMQMRESSVGFSQTIRHLPSDCAPSCIFGSAGFHPLWLEGM